MNSLCSELRWLLPAPKDFCDRLKAAGDLPGLAGGELQPSTQHGSNLNQLTKLPFSTGFTIVAEAPVS